MTTVRVPLAERSYDVVIEAGALAHAGERLAPLSRGRGMVIVTDENLRFHLATLQSALVATGVTSEAIVLPPGEGTKSWAQLEALTDRLLALGVERGDHVVALGGGVIGDLVGFACSILKRGCGFVQVPTTLLAQVDSSVGGKTAINSRAGKNLIGAFHQPLGVFIDPDVLGTLSHRELRSGLAECVKHEIIRDAGGFADLERDLDSVLALEPTRLATLIAHNVRIKANVVMNDPFENGERAHLNLGHTFGHAIETVSNYEYAHGEAIALGIVAACRTANEIGLLTKVATDRVRKLLQRVGLPTGKMTLDADAVYSAMFSDKKVKAGRLRLVLPDRIGHVVIRDDVPPATVQTAIRSLAK